MNSIIAIAVADDRQYITPEDVEDAFRQFPDDPHRVRLDLLEVLGNTTGFGAEDSELCAFVGFLGQQP